MAKGFRPQWIGQQKYEWFYIYGAVEPTTGRSVFYLMPDLTKESVNIFLEGFKKEVGKDVLLVWDRAGAHRALSSHPPDGINLIFLPAYSPELNPVESVWKVLRKKLANQVFQTIEQLEAAVTDALKQFWHDPQILISLTAFPWWRKAVDKRHH